MAVKGKRVRIQRWIHALPCVVQVEVEAVIPDNDPSEPCLEPQTIRWLDDVQRKADAGEIEKLAGIGQVYVRRPA